MSTEIQSWFTGRLPAEWTATAPAITVDREEILVMVCVPAPDVAGGDEQATASAAAGRIARFREETREQRIAIAQEAEQRFERKVSWGARCGDVQAAFTTVSMPVMTRLRQAERIVLDTLVEAGVARSRSDALGWCVRLVGQHSQEWLGQLREAMREVQRLRETGPAAAASQPAAS
ncbi:MAG TPA: hypothetical protein VHB69_07300 [Mycobacteriales bacterium]|nr:hypothetical protein [Mycobacteriales bacterium]